MTRQLERSYVALGSNLGNREAHLARGRLRLSTLRHTHLVAASSIEETALAVEILLDARDDREPDAPARGDDIPRSHEREPDAPAGADEIPRSHEREPDAPATGDDIPRSRVGLNAGRVDAAVNNGLAWLVQQVESGGLAKPTPIGFYFAKLWYFEKLYPIIFTVAALGRARRKRT